MLSSHKVAKAAKRWIGPGRRSPGLRWPVVARTDDSTAHASNWRVVLGVDAVLGILVSLAGVAVAVWGNAAVGAAVAALGAGYVALVGARARRWSRLRRSAPH